VSAICISLNNLNFIIEIRLIGLVLKSESYKVFFLAYGKLSSCLIANELTTIPLSADL
jgi:hypothetical protein